MRLLSIDTSFSFFNLSVVEEGNLSTLYYEDSKKKGLELLPPS
jgi:tRNA threonylcarbamoyladenosine biosynthesis protein TsaB